jgi:hypothetical protein
MAKRGSFGGSRFGYSGFGRSGFKKGFGRSSFGQGQAVSGFGIAEEMMRMFKEMQTPKFGMKPEAREQTVGGPAAARKFTSGQGMPVIPRRSENTFTTPPLSFLNPEGTPAQAETGTMPKGGPKQKKVKFRPKLTRGAR